jgi:hypothetical protein
MQNVRRAARPEIDRKIRRKTGRETAEEQSRGPYGVHIREKRRSSKFSSVQALTDTGMEMLG